VRTKFTLADLRMKLAVRLAVAPRSLFKQLWLPQSRPYEKDAAREELVAFITQGWDSLEIDATGPEMPSGHVPYSALGEMIDEQKDPGDAKA
jgi:hypothetical protein